MKTGFFYIYLVCLYLSRLSYFQQLISKKVYKAEVGWGCLGCGNVCIGYDYVLQVACCWLQNGFLNMENSNTVWEWQPCKGKCFFSFLSECFIPFIYQKYVITLFFVSTLCLFVLHVEVGKRCYVNSITLKTNWTKEVDSNKTHPLSGTW